MRHSQDCLGAGEPCCYGSLAPDDAFAHPVPSPSAAHAELLALAREADEWLDTPAVYEPSADFHRLQADATHTARLLRAITNAITKHDDECAELAEQDREARTGWGYQEGLTMLATQRAEKAESALATALRAASPSPVSCEHCGLPWGDGTAHATTAWACDPPAACPSPGAVEAAYREGYERCFRRRVDSVFGADDKRDLDDDWQSSAARRGAAGGQDG